MSKGCQLVKKMSNCQKSVKCQKIKHLDFGKRFTKNLIDIMRFTDIDVTHEGHRNWQKIISIDILRVFADLHM